MGEDGNMHEYGGDDGLDFKFRIKKPLGAVRMEADISILGLTLETIKYLTTWEPWNVATAKKRKIEVYAGYEATGAQLLFEGYIVHALPTQPPEMWLNIKADNISYLDTASYSLDSRTIKPKPQVVPEHPEKELKGPIIEAKHGLMAAGKAVTVQDVFLLAAKKLNLSPDWRGNLTGPVIETFTFNGTSQELIDKLNTLASMRVYEEDGMLVATPIEPSNKSRRNLKVNTDNGMLGISEINFTGIVFRNRLTTDYNRFDWVDVESDLIGGATGTYLVYQVEYSGHYRGNEWEVKVWARSQKNFEKTK